MRASLQVLFDYGQRSRETIGGDDRFRIQHAEDQAGRVLNCEDDRTVFLDEFVKIVRSGNTHLAEIIRAMLGLGPNAVVTAKHACIAALSALLAELRQFEVGWLYSKRLQKDEVTAP